MLLMFSIFAFIFLLGIMAGVYEDGATYGVSQKMLELDVVTRQYHESVIDSDLGKLDSEMMKLRKIITDYEK